MSEREKMCKLLVTVDHQFVRTPDGRVWVKTIYEYDFWKRYLNVFDSVRIVCRIQDVSEINEKMLLSSGDKVEFFALPQYRGPKEFALKYFKIKKQMRGVAEGCDCALFRIPSPIANGVQKEAVKKGLPWAVEIVNDPWDTFAPGSYKGITRPFVRVFFTHQVKSMARRANGASYVTKFALQNRYPSAARLQKKGGYHFENYYSSINLKENYFYEDKRQPEAPYTIVHVNSCITDYSKGHDVVLRCVKRMLDRGINSKIVFVGDGPARPEFEKMAKDLGIENRVMFTGMLHSSGAVREHLIQADLMIFPTKGEGLPRTVIEAMAVGLPCISTPVNGIPELLDKKDMMTQQDDLAFATRAEEILTDREMYQRISKKNISKAKEYVNSVLSQRRDVFYAQLKKKISKE